MAAHDATVAALYLKVCELAYTETQLAITPSAPFVLGDRAGIKTQAQATADAAKRLRGLKPADLDQGQVDAAALAVAKAQSALDTIANEVSNTLSSAAVFLLMGAAMTAVNAV